MATWLRQQASRSDLDHATPGAVQTLGFCDGVLRYPLSRTGPWEQRRRLYERYREVRAELAESRCRRHADWAARTLAPSFAQPQNNRA